MSILQMVQPRLERLAELAGEPGIVRDPVAVAELRESYRYLASLCRTLLPELEPELADLPPSLAPGAEAAERVAFQMSLVKRTNRLHRAVAAHLGAPLAGRDRALSR